MLCLGRTATKSDSKSGAAEGEATSEGYLSATEDSPVDVQQVAETHPEGDLKDLERSRYHVMGRRGWTSDPCGPMFFKGW